MERFIEVISSTIKRNHDLRHRAIVLALDIQPSVILEIVENELRKYKSEIKTVICRNSLNANKSADRACISYDKASAQLGKTNDLVFFENLGSSKPNQLAMLMETVCGGGAVIISLATDEYKAVGLYYRRMLRMFESMLTVNGEFQILKGVNSNSNNSNNSNKTDNEIENVTKMCANNEQVEIVEHCYENITKNKTYNSKKKSIISISSKRGRGKSTAVGLAIAALLNNKIDTAIICASTSESVQEMFRFCISGLQELTNEVKLTKSGNNVVCVEIKGTEKSVRFFSPEKTCAGNADLLVVDEAATVPVNFLHRISDVNNLILITTLGGYEGTGKSYTQKYIKETETRRGIVHLEMNEPVRYAQNDPLEREMNNALLLYLQEPSIPEPVRSGECTENERCGVFLVGKNVLLSGEPESEKVLKEIYKIWASTHYRNSPDDLKIYADNEEHSMFVCVNGRGEIVGAMETVEEGGTRKKEGNMIPWIIHSAYGDESLFFRKGVRITRISVLPQWEGRGIGSFLLRSALTASKDGNPEIPSHLRRFLTNPAASDGWVGVSFGFTEPLFNFWAKNGFKPFCIKQTLSERTGEHSIVMIRDGMDHSAEFYNRFLQLTRFSFKNLKPHLCLSIIHSSVSKTGEFKLEMMAVERILRFLKDCNESVLQIIDLFPEIAMNYFRSIHVQKLSVIQQAVLLMVGLQNKLPEEVSIELGIRERKVETIMRDILKELVGIC